MASDFDLVTLEFNASLDAYFELVDPSTKKDRLWNLLTQFGPKLKSSSFLTGDPHVWMREFSRRQIITTKLCWGYPSQKVISEIKDFIGPTPTVECNAGNGLWSYLLQLEGVNVTATDIRPWEKCFTPVQVMDAITAVKTLPLKGCIFTCWPDYGYSYITEAIKCALAEGRVDKIIYVGEGEGGCTGDDALHDLLESYFTCEKTVSNPRWAGIHDMVYLYRIK
jgi:hypothetical protein